MELVESDSTHGGENYEKTEFLEEPYYGGEPLFSDYVDYFYLETDTDKLPRRKPQPLTVCLGQAYLCSTDDGHWPRIWITQSVGISTAFQVGTASGGKLLTMAKTTS